jgi:hypothetical protein
MKNPFSVLRHFARDKAPRMPQAVGALILGVSATAATSVVIAGATYAVGAYIVGYIAITAVTSVVLKALSPKPSSGQYNSASSAGLLANVMDAVAPHEYVYGKVRKGGIRTYLESTGTSNNYLHMIIALAGHEVSGIDDIYINDEIVTLDANGFVTGSKWNSKVRIKKHLGNQTTVDPDLFRESNQITTNFIGKGIAYLYVRLEYDQDVFANGIPLFTATVRGRKVYDPRASTTAYSANAALAVRDYLTAPFGLNDNSIDDLSFATSANVSDELITLSAGGTEKRYEVNGVLTADMTPRQVMDRMMPSCGGTLFWGQGAWQLHVAYYSAPVTTFTLDDLRSSISLDTRSSSRDNFNRVTGTFIDAAAGYISGDYPAIESPTFLAEDNGVENTLDLQFAMVTSSSAAQRLAKMILFRAREQMTLTAEFGMAAFGVQVGDIIAFTNPRYGWVAKEFEVAGWRFETAQGGDIRVGLTLREISAAAFDWNAEEAAIIRNNTTLPNYRDVGTVGLSIGAELRVVNQAVVGILQVDLTSNSPFSNQFEVQYRKTGATDWISLGNSSNVRFEATSIDDGYYDIRARAISTLNIRGSWTTVSNYYVSVFSEPPSAVTNFAGNVVGNSLHLTWTPVPELDLSHYKIRFSTATTGATYSDAVDVVTKIARPANSTVVPARTGTYFIKAFDKLGNGSLTATSFAVFTDSRDFDNLNFIETVTEHPTFSGNKDTVAVTDFEGMPVLVLDTSTQFDDVEGLFDSADGFFDGASGGVASAGIYYFANYVDLGAKYVSRVHTDISLFRLDYVNTFDAADGLFDARTGDFDGSADIFDDISVRTQVSTTDDDPAGTPTWSDWSDFFVGDVAGRAIRFRAILTTTDPTATPAISAMSATVDMPDRMEADSDIAFVGTTNVVFPSSFKNIPSIGLSLTNMADGQRYAITSKTNSGFTLTVYDAGGAVATNSVTLDYVAKGYGKGI